MKQAILIRKDLKITRGKLISQACHASIGAYLRAKRSEKERWEKSGMKKIILKISSERELLNFYKKVKKEKLPCELIVDMGLTQIKPGTVTALGIGPAADKKIDKITRKLKLL